MKLIGTIQPFMGMQTIHIYDDSNKELEYRLAYLHNYSAVIMNILNEYPEVVELNLYGAEQFCQKLKTEIEENLLTKFNNKNRIEVKIL